jgi:hypothetical protein
MWPYCGHEIGRPHRFPSHLHLDKRSRESLTITATLPPAGPVQQPHPVAGVRDQYNSHDIWAARPAVVAASTRCLPYCLSPREANSDQ